MIYLEFTITPQNEPKQTFYVYKKIPYNKCSDSGYYIYKPNSETPIHVSKRRLTQQEWRKANNVSKLKNPDLEWMVTSLLVWDKITDI